MNLDKIYESDIEEASLAWLANLGYTVLHGPDISPDAPNAERSTYKEVVLDAPFTRYRCPLKSKHTC